MTGTRLGLALGGALLVLLPGAALARGGGGGDAGSGLSPVATGTPPTSAIRSPPRWPRTSLACAVEPAPERAYFPASLASAWPKRSAKNTRIIRSPRRMASSL